MKHVAQKWSTGLTRQIRSVLRQLERRIELEGGTAAWLVRQWDQTNSC
jgi:hypothetical protein